MARQERWLRALIALALAGALLALSPAGAGAKVIHHVEGNFLGEGAPGGLGADLLSDAVDNSGGPSAGDVYVLEARLGGAGQDVVDKFTAQGAYAGVQISGAETGPHSFEFEPLGSGVAVDSSLSLDAGDVYVADTEHRVVDRFSEAGKFICQIAGGETEASTPATECDVAGSGLAGKMSPTGLAVDASGDVYVADDQHAQIVEFGPEGHLIRSISKKEGHLSNEMTTIALGSGGEVYVTNFPSTVIELGAKGEFVREFGETALGVAVDQATSPNRVYVDEGPTLAEYEPSGALRSDTALTGGASFFPALAVAEATGEIYAGAAGLVQKELPQGVDVVGPDVVLPFVTTEAASEVGRSSATLHGTVEPDLFHGGGDVTACQFEYVTEAAFQEHPKDHFEGATVAPCEAATPLPYSETQPVKASAALAPSTTYHVRLFAADAEGANDGEGEASPEVTLTTSGPATVDAESAKALTHSATFAAQINPRGVETTCQLQYVDATAFAASGYEHATVVPCPQALGSGAADREVSIAVTGLAIGTTYHYRFQTANEAGSSAGPDRTVATFGVASFSVEAVDREGHPYTQAGGHPYALRTAFMLNGGGHAEAIVKDVETALPAGLIGNPTATSRCTREQLTNFVCSGAAQVGLLTLYLDGGEFSNEPVYNLVPPPGVPAEFGVRFNTYTNIYIDANVRTGGDYGVTATVSNGSGAAAAVGAEVEFWGVPGDPSHDPKRFCPVSRKGEPEHKPCTVNVQQVPFLRNPTTCGGPLTASITVDAWQAAGQFTQKTTQMPAITGCEVLGFGPAATLQPDTSQADSPSGLHFDLTTPQNELSDGVGDADLRESTVALPAGMTVNPAGANGLQACSPAEIALDSAAAPSCPSPSRIGTVEIDTPLLSAPLTGSVYVAEQDNNPFDSLLAIYVVADADGALVKLAGHVEANQETGQLTTTFENLPQVPFTALKLDLFGGAHASLATPESCGTFTTNTLWGPWSGTSPLASPNSFQITSGCAAGFAPSFQAGTVSPAAGAFSPFVLSFSRTDGEQPPADLSVTLPPGLLAKIAGVPLCSDADANAGACPQASQIGTVETGAGVGPGPIFLPGKIYLTGPYKGAPYGESVVVPAVAGPFNLGDVVVRGAIHIDPRSAQATITSDPFPTILQGIPVKLRSVAVTIDRPGFTFNPTNCNPLRVEGELESLAHLSSSVSAPFALGDCAALKFTPAFAVSVAGHASKRDGVGVVFKFAYPSGAMGAQSWFEETKLEIPKQLPARLPTLQQACLAHVFEVERSKCPAHSVSGHAIVHTQTLPDPLEGPVYLVSYGGAKFPDAVLVLSGDNVHIELRGETFIDGKTGITSVTFRHLPDVPFESVEVNVPAGEYSEFGANLEHGNRYDFCGRKLVMPTVLNAQNGLAIDESTPIKITGCPKVGAKHPKGHGSRRRRARHATVKRATRR